MRERPPRRWFGSYRDAHEPDQPIEPLAKGSGLRAVATRSMHSTTYRLVGRYWIVSGEPVMLHFIELARVEGLPADAADSEKVDLRRYASNAGGAFSVVTTAAQEVRWGEGIEGRVLHG
jgi:hypothetical protein